MFAQCFSKITDPAIHLILYSRPEGGVVTQSNINKHTSHECMTSREKTDLPLPRQCSGNVITTLNDTDQGVCQLSMVIIQWDMKQAKP